MQSTTGKTGKLKAIKDDRNFTFANYVNLNVIRIPNHHDWTSIRKNKWDVFGNDRLNNCTCAAAGHMITCWTANSSSVFEITEAAIISGYSELSKYNPKTGKNDSGVYMLDALKHWRKKGFDGHKIRVFATIPHDQREIVKAAIYIFGGIYAGLQLPKSIIGQKIWEVKPGELIGDSEPWSWGGHAVSILAYDEKYLTCITCGEEQKMTWEFWETYNDEAYAIITEDFFNKGQTPVGLDLDGMENDLMQLTQAKIRLAKRLAEEKLDLEGT